MKKFAAAVMAAGALTMLAGCSKPDESEVHEKVAQDAQDLGLDAETAEAFADCAAPKLHDELSRSSLNTLLEDGLADAKVSSDDADAGDKIITDCLSEVGAA